MDGMKSTKNEPLGPSLTSSLLECLHEREETEQKSKTKMKNMCKVTSMLIDVVLML